MLQVEICGQLKYPCTLHWGVMDGSRAYQWLCPPEIMRPKGTVVADPKRACQTLFEVDPETKLQKITVRSVPYENL